MTDSSQAFDKLEDFLTECGLDDRTVLDSVRAFSQTDGMNPQDVEQAGILIEHFVKELGDKSVKQNLLKAVHEFRKVLALRPAGE